MKIKLLSSTHSGNIFLIKFFYSSDNDFGYSITYLICKSPNSLCKCLLGIPSLAIIFHEKGYTTSFYFEETSIKCSSKWLILFLYPSKASSKLIFKSTNKLSPTLLNLGWGCYFILKITSPGIISGIYSASLSKTIWSPFAIPFSIVISKFF